MARDQIDLGNQAADEAGPSASEFSASSLPEPARGLTGRLPVARALVGAGVIAGCFAVAGCNPATKTSAVQSSEKVAVASVDARKNTRGPIIGRPYKVADRWYTPAHDPNYKAVGVASWYGLELHGRMTASGEAFDSTSITVAHPTLPMPSYVRVTNLKNGRSIVARVNDRGPFSRRRLVDVSERVASLLDFKRSGSARVSVEYVGSAPIGADDTDRLLATYSEPGKPGRSLSGEGERNMLLASAGPTAVYSFQQGLQKLESMMPTLAPRTEPVSPPPSHLPEVAQMTVAGLSTALPEVRPGSETQVAQAEQQAAPVAVRPQPAAAVIMASAVPATTRHPARAATAEAAVLASAPAAVPAPAAKAPQVAEVAVLESDDPDMPPVKPGTMVVASAAAAAPAAASVGVEPAAYAAAAYARSGDPAGAAARVANTAPIAEAYVYTPFVPASGEPMQLSAPGTGVPSAAGFSGAVLTQPAEGVVAPAADSISMVGSVTPSSSSFARTSDGTAAMQAASRFGALSASSSWRQSTDQ